MVTVNPRPARRLGLAQLVNSVGDGAYYVTSALYFHRVVGLSATQLGLGLTIAWGAGFVAGTPLGSWADRRGPRGVAVALALATAVAVAGFLVVSGPIGFCLAATAYATAQSGLAAARMALLAATIPPEQRTAVRARLQAILNGGLAVGATIGALALSVDTAAAYRAVLAVDAASFVVAALVLSSLAVTHQASSSAVAAPRLTVLRDRPFVVVTALNAVLMLYMPLLSLVLPLWVAGRTEAPSWAVGGLLVVNTLGVMTVQVRAARRVQSLTDATRSVRLAGVVMSLACAAFAVTDPLGTPALALAVLLIGAVLQVAAEVLQASGCWEISFGLAPADRQGQYQGFFGGGVPLARMVGPLLLSTLILEGGVVGWAVFAAGYAAAAALMGPAVRTAERRTTRQLTTSPRSVTADVRISATA